MSSTATFLIQAAYREGNLIPVGSSPSTAEMTEALPALNRLVDGIFGYEMGENLVDWLYPAPQRTAPVAARWPQAPRWDECNILLGSQTSSAIYPYPPVNSRIIFGNVTGKLYFPEKPQDGSRMALVGGSGQGDNGISGCASGVFTATQQPAAADTITVGTKDGVTAAVYTWQTVVANPFDVQIGASIPASLNNLVQAINGGLGNGTQYGAGTTPNFSVTGGSALDVLTATAILQGTPGNSIASTVTGSMGTWGAATLVGGVTGSVLTLDGNGRLINGAPQQAYYSPVGTVEWFYRAGLGMWMLKQLMTLTDMLIFPSEFDDFFICALAKRLAPRYGKVTANETLETAAKTLARIKARYRQVGLTTYGSENFPRTNESFLGGSWWW